MYIFLVSLNFDFSHEFLAGALLIHHYSTVNGLVVHKLSRTVQRHFRFLCNGFQINRIFTSLLIFFSQFFR